MVKFKIADPELEGGTREIYEEIQAIKAKKGGKDAAAVEGAEDEDWATDSEEDVDADDDDADEEMKE